MRSPILVTALALLTVVVAGGCRRKAGGTCKGNESLCLDPATALACRSGTLVPVACAGPMACAKYQDHANCDTSVGIAGQDCMGEDDEYACSPDKKHAVVCRGTKFEPWLECRGPAGCSMLGRTVSCDITVAVKADPCKTQGAVACSEDKAQMLICRDGKFELYRYCRGQYGCFLKENSPSCDETISLAGDPCGISGQVVCASDGKTELVCQGGIFQKSLTCKTSCTISTRPGRPIDCR
jgi:hypothetical protein